MTLPAFAPNQSFPEMYERALVAPLFRPWAEDLLDRLRVGAGDRVLDVACGTGIVARIARQRMGPGARVVGVDASAPMLAVARTVAPNVEWREGSAVALPVEGGESFDVVTCQQGLQFFPDNAVAAREMRRVLAPGGRLGLSVWRGLEDNVFFRELHAIAERHLGPLVDARHSYGDGEALARLLRDAGFHDVHVERLVKTIRFGDGALFIRMNTMALVGMSAVSKTMDEQQKSQTVDRITTDSGSVLARYSDAGGLAFELTSNVATAIT
jgi:ubiquinone/menaquinone biosynthesis C-methylase UbiE